MAKLKKMTAAKAAMIPSQVVDESMRWAKRVALNMGDPLGSGYGDDFDRVRADDSHDLDVCPGGNRFMSGHSLVFHGAVLQVEMDLAGAAALSWDRQVDG